MYVGRVLGRVVATRHIAGLTGVKLLIVMPLDESGVAVAESVVACVAGGAGRGDVVHVCDGREATLALRERFVPVDATIVGHVEEFAHDGTLVPPPRPKRRPPSRNRNGP